MQVMWTILLVLAFAATSLGTNLIAESAGYFVVDIENIRGETVAVITSGSATANEDYIPTALQQTIPFNISIIDDDVNEELEVINVQVDLGNNTFDLQFFIRDDDAVTITALADTFSFEEGENVTIDLTCATIPHGSNSFTYTVHAVDGTAVYPSDYMFDSLNIVCDPMDRTVSLDIQLVENSVHSSNKTFSLQVVSSFTVAGITDITINILEDDAPPCTPPCQHGGSCVSGSCQCVDGYTGSFCESKDC